MKTFKTYSEAYALYSDILSGREWEEWRRTRTEVIGEMIENPDHIGIFPTTKCFNALDEAVNKLLTSTEERVRESIVGILEEKLSYAKKKDTGINTGSPCIPQCHDITERITLENAIATIKNHK